MADQVILWHGTTALRADAILIDGPDPDYREPGSSTAPEGFSMSPASGPFFLGGPKDYARGKSLLFPDEGGPAILEVEVPVAIARMALLGDSEADLVRAGELFFQQNYGLRELLHE